MLFVASLFPIWAIGGLLRYSVVQYHISTLDVLLLLACHSRKQYSIYAFSLILLINTLPTTEDMSASFLTLPSELRNTVYEQCFLHPEPINPWMVFNHRRELAPGLLCTSRTVNLEASSVFYAQNIFDFTKMTPKDVAVFLGTIGRNADYIEHVCIDFPSLRDLEPGHFALSKKVAVASSRTSRAAASI